MSAKLTKFGGFYDVLMEKDFFALASANLSATSLRSE